MRIEILRESNTNVDLSQTHIVVNKSIAAIRADNSLESELSKRLAQYLKFTLKLEVPRDTKFEISSFEDSIIKKVKVLSRLEDIYDGDEYYDFDIDAYYLSSDEIMFNTSIEIKWKAIRSNSLLASGSMVLNFKKVIAKIEDIRQKCHTSDLSDQMLQKCLLKMNPSDFYFNRATLDSIDVSTEYISEALSLRDVKGEKEFERQLTPNQDFTFEGDLRKILRKLILSVFDEFSDIRSIKGAFSVEASLSKFSIDDIIRNKKKFQFSWSIFEPKNRLVLASGISICKIKEDFFLRRYNFTLKELYIKGKIFFDRIDLIR